MAGRLGESRNDASDKNNTSRAGSQPEIIVACGREAVAPAGEACVF